MKTQSLHLALACAVLLAAAGACAQTAAGKPRATTLGGGAASGTTLTREQLRQCLVEQDGLKSERDTLARDQQAIDAEKTELKNALAALNAQLEIIDKGNADAVKAHMEKAKAHDERVEAWNGKLPAFNERVGALQKRNEAWKADCADRPYKEDDLILLQARKQVPAGAR